MAVRETELKVIVDTNNRLIASQNVKTEIKQNFVRMEVTIPKIIEKVITIEKFVERESDQARTKLMEEERALLRKEIKLEFGDRISELESNILAYQDLLIEKETEIKAYATELARLQQFKGGLKEAQLIESLKKLIAEKQKEIEALKTTDIQVGGLPQKVYKKLEHVNAQIEEKLNVVHKNYKKEIMKKSEAFLKEIEGLK